MKNQAGVKLENQAVIYRFRWDSWAAATFGPPTRTSTTTQTATNFRFNLVDQHEISTMASKSPSRHWKTSNWKTSDQLKTLEKKQADLLKLFSRRVTELEGYLTQNKTMTAESAYRGFFETNDNLKAKRKQQSIIRSHYRDLINLKQYGQSKDFGNQTSSVSSTSAVDKDQMKL